MHRLLIQFNLIRKKLLLVLSKDFKESIPIEIVSITGGVAAGFILAIGLNLLELIPSMLILIPGFLEINGSISSSLASRLAAGMFLGVVKPNFKTHRILVGNAIAGIALSLIVSLFLGLLAYFFEFIFFNTLNTKIIFISLLATMISSPIMILVTIIFSIWFFRKGYDPNNIMGPYITTLGDIIGIMSLILASIVVIFL